MPTALDMFRAQRDAAERVHSALVETAALLKALQDQVDALGRNQHLTVLFHDERTLLARAETFLTEVRYVREQEIARFWPAVWRRWLLALAFALAAATAAGAGYSWIRKPDAEELARLRARTELADLIARRVMAMSPAERRQLDALMRWGRPTEP